MALARHLVRLPDDIRAKAPLLKEWSYRIRSRHLFVVDAFGVAMASLIALAAWQEQIPAGDLLGVYLWVVGIIVCAHLAANIVLGLYTNSWRFASIGDMGRILACAFAGSASAMFIVLAIIALDPPVATNMPPAAFWMIEVTLALGVLATPRFMIRAASNLNDRVEGHSARQPTLLYGAGWAGVMVARSAGRAPDSGVLPVGFLDDNPALKGTRVAGLLVHGDVAAIARAKRLTGAESLLITMPGANGASIRRVVEAGMKHELDVRTVPAITDLIDGSIDATRLRRVRVEDLLRRPPVTEHSPALQELLRDETVMITGAAGSIGSELVRQVLLLEPRRIVMVDQSESAMYMIARDLETRSQVLRGSTTITTHLVDITDREAIRKLMCAASPIIVFHAAAYKHVPMLEEHASQATRVNLGGTRSVVDAAIDCDVERFVLVSTDKAVRPTSVMGASKRLAEMVVSDAARRTGRAFVSVRFGNVLGSSGSVIPVFQSQLENGQPLTVTDPEMTRYFMTIPEAAWLILDASTLSEGGGLCVLDMGEPVRVMDVATDLIRLSGRDPDSVPIEIVGLRAGEKLHEELFYDEEDAIPTEIPKVLRSTADQATPATIQADVDRFLRLAGDGQDDVLRRDLLRYVSFTAADNAHPFLENGYRPVVPVSVANGNGVGSNGVPSGTNGNGSAAKTSHGDGVRPPGREPASMHEKVVIKPPAVIRVAGDDAQAAADRTVPRGAARK